MFEDSLLIIKSDYLHKRKPILIHALQEGFQIQGRRRLLFSPEHAAEFYQDDADDKCFMLLVIMLSKGSSEAFILTKENAVEELMNTMVCYFGTSCEMERNVHVSRTVNQARREITYIFPNYIHEPIPLFQNAKFANIPLIKDILTEVYDIISDTTGYPKNWKAKLSEWLAKSNATLPRISNQCRCIHSKPMDDKTTLISPVIKKTAQPCSPPHESPSRHSLSLSSAGSSMMMTSSSCITCSCFDGGEVCYNPPKEKDSLERLVKAKTMRKHSSTSSCGEQSVEWVEVVEGDEGEVENIEQEFGSRMDTRFDLLDRQSNRGSEAEILVETAGEAPSAPPALAQAPPPPVREVPPPAEPAPGRD